MISRQEHDTFGRQLHAGHMSIAQHRTQHPKSGVLGRRLENASKALRVARSQLENEMFCQHGVTANTWAYFPGGSPPMISLDEIRAAVGAILARISSELCPNRRACKALGKALELR